MIKTTFIDLLEEILVKRFGGAWQMKKSDVRHMKLAKLRKQFDVSWKSLW